MSVTRIKSQDCQEYADNLAGKTGKLILIERLSKDKSLYSINLIRLTRVDEPKKPGSRIFVRGLIATYKFGRPEVTLLRQNDIFGIIADTDVLVVGPEGEVIDEFLLEYRSGVHSGMERAARAGIEFLLEKPASEEE